MFSSRSLQEFEDLILNNPISYGVSLNLGFCGEDKALLLSDWLSEFKDDRAEIDQKVFPLLYNYELVPNQSDSKKSLVSKHCIINKTDNISGTFFSKEFYYHVNW